MVEKSLALATALTPIMGYNEAARICQNAYQEGKTIRQVVEEEGLLSRDDLDRVLNPLAMVSPGKISRTRKKSSRK